MYLTMREMRDVIGAHGSSENPEQKSQLDDWTAGGNVEAVPVYNV